MTHALDDNEQAREYFLRQNKNGKAAYRQACRDITGALPIWAEQSKGGRPRKPVATDMQKTVTTDYLKPVVTCSDQELVTTPIKVTTCFIDPLAISPEEMASLRAR
jgi:hypothetical protein